MTLHSSNKAENIKASVEKYLYDRFVTTSSLKVDWPGRPLMDLETITEWVQPRLLRGRTTYCRQVSSTTKGNEIEYLLNVNIFVTKLSTQYNAHRLSELRDIVAQYLEEDTKIPIYNYSGDSSFIANAIIREIVTDMEIPVSFGENFKSEDLVYQWNYTTSLVFISQFTGD